MGKRLTRIYTRTGDAGETGLADGSRVPKDGLRVVAIGEVDELNSVLGLVLAYEVPPRVRQVLSEVQHRLFDLGGELALPQRVVVTQAAVASLEQALDGFNQDLPPLQEFILPGGGLAAGTCHLARAVCRRAERSVVALGHHEAINPELLAYLNRLSDVLFVVSRVLSRMTGHGEVYWRSSRGRTPDTAAP